MTFSSGFGGWGSEAPPPALKRGRWRAGQVEKGDFRWKRTQLRREPAGSMRLPSVWAPQSGVSQRGVPPRPPATSVVPSSATMLSKPAPPPPAPRHQDKRRECPADGDKQGSENHKEPPHHPPCSASIRFSATGWTSARQGVANQIRRPRPLAPAVSSVRHPARGWRAPRRFVPFASRQQECHQVVTFFVLK